MPKFTTKLGTTYFIKKGRKSLKTPLISCHGGPGGTHHSIKPILELSDQRQVVVYDQIGSGLSSPLDEKKWTIDTFCQNLEELRQFLNYDKMILHGSSWGGTLILEYYRRHPQRVAGLIFHSSLICEKTWRKDAKRLITKLPAKTQKVISACESVGATDSKVYKDAMTEYYKKHVCRDPKAWESKKSTRSKPNEKLYQKMWGPSEFCATGSLKGYNGKPLLKQINIPVLFISGQYDEATPQSAKNFSKMLKEGYFKEIKQASHSSLREKKTETLKAFKTFFHKANI